MLFQMTSLFSAVGRNGKGYTIVGVRSLVVDEVNRQISLFYIYHRLFNLHCDVIDVLKVGECPVNHNLEVSTFLD